MSFSPLAGPGWEAASPPCERDHPTSADPAGSCWEYGLALLQPDFSGGGDDGHGGAWQPFMPHGGRPELSRGVLVKLRAHLVSEPWKGALVAGGPPARVLSMLLCPLSFAWGPCSNTQINNSLSLPCFLHL